MKSFLAILSIIGVLFAVSTNAQAIVIVDTGEPSSDEFAWSLYTGQWLAGEFITGQAYTVTDIRGWIRRTGGTLTLALYGDGGEVPDTTNELLSSTFAVPDEAGSGWYGLSGLSYYLPAGTYWAAFEVRGGDTYAGGMNEPAPSPLVNEAVKHPGDPYFEADFINIGVRIEANPTDNIIPEPASLSLLGLGLFGLFGVRKGRRV